MGVDAGVRASPTAPSGPSETSAWLEAYGRQMVPQAQVANGHVPGGSSAPRSQEEGAWPQLQVGDNEGERRREGEEGEREGLKERGSGAHNEGVLSLRMALPDEKLQIAALTFPPWSVLW